MCVPDVNISLSEHVFKKDHIYLWFSFFLFFPGSDIVQWLIKNLTIEDPGK